MRGWRSYYRGHKYCQLHSIVLMQQLTGPAHQLASLPRLNKPLFGREYTDRTMNSSKPL